MHTTNSVKYMMSELKPHCGDIAMRKKEVYENDSDLPLLCA